MNKKIFFWFKLHQGEINRFSITDLLRINELRKRIITACYMQHVYFICVLNYTFC